MVLKLILAKKFSELLLFEVRFKFWLQTNRLTDGWNPTLLWLDIQECSGIFRIILLQKWFWNNNAHFWGVCFLQLFYFLAPYSIFGFFGTLGGSFLSFFSLVFGHFENCLSYCCLKLD